MCGKCKPEMYTRLYTVVSPLHASSTARSRCIVGVYFIFAHPPPRTSNIRNKIKYAILYIKLLLYTNKAVTRRAHSQSVVPRCVPICDPPACHPASSLPRDQVATCCV